MRMSASRQTLRFIRNFAAQRINQHFLVSGASLDFGVFGGCLYLISPALGTSLLLLQYLTIGVIFFELYFLRLVAWPVKITFRKTYVFYT